MDNMNQQQGYYQMPPNNGAYNVAPATDIRDSAFRGLVVHTLLLFFTLGIYWFIWVYKTTEETNMVQNMPYRDPIVELLLCIFIPGYYIFWCYKTGQRVDAISRQYGQTSRMTLMAPLCNIFSVFFPAILLQDKINEVILQQRKMNPNYMGPHKQTIPNHMSPFETGFIKLIPHTLLLVFTCGIWGFIWVYKTTEFLNRVTDEPVRDTVVELLLCIFIPGYLIFWLYKSGQLVDKMAGEFGQDSHLTVIAPLTGGIGIVLMQDKINEIIIQANNYQHVVGGMF